MKLELSKPEASTLRTVLRMAMMQTSNGTRTQEIFKRNCRALLDKLEKSRGGMPVMKIGGGR